MAALESGQMMDYHPDDSILSAYRTIDGVFNSRVDTDYPEAILPHPEPESWVPGKY